MLKKVNMAQEESNTTLTNVNETPTSNKSYLAEHIPVANSPLTITQLPEGWFIRAGSYRLSEIFSTKQQAEEAIETHKWELIVQLIMIICDGILEERAAKNS